MCSCPSLLLNIICWGEQSWYGAGNRHREPQEIRGGGLMRACQSFQIDFSLC